MRITVLVAVVMLAMTSSRVRVDAGEAVKAGPDQAFMLKAMEAGLAEIELGKLAMRKGARAEVREFAGWMVTDHTKANRALKSLAETKHIAVASALDVRDQALYDTLSRLSGNDFDQAYMWAVIKDHQHRVSESRREVRIGKDAEVKAFASKILGTVEDHLRMADSTDAVVRLTAVRTEERNAATRGA